MHRQQQEADARHPVGLVHCLRHVVPQEKLQGDLALELGDLIGAEAASTQGQGLAPPERVVVIEGVAPRLSEVAAGDAKEAVYEKIAPLRGQRHPGIEGDDGVILEDGEQVDVRDSRCGDTANLINGDDALNATEALDEAFDGALVAVGRNVARIVDERDGLGAS